ncbi:hypothetical protein HMPREF1979_01661 [Actinomyces johnsonii F0542]|uniref:Uncharacterized protein n=1 Tax=Actinomyces johnsonii F0542 TaxID=1321818 RepID=U1RVW5_9ACTO|nr:hypothetical protein HMPREF1979_01661 [Actinomyces johnsonii F0542]
MRRLGWSSSSMVMVKRCMTPMAVMARGSEGASPGPEVWLGRQRPTGTT